MKIGWNLVRVVKETSNILNLICFFLIWSKFLKIGPSIPTFRHWIRDFMKQTAQSSKSHKYFANVHVEGCQKVKLSSVYERNHNQEKFFHRQLQLNPVAKRSRLLRSPYIRVKSSASIWSELPESFKLLENALFCR